MRPTDITQGNITDWVKDGATIAVSGSGGGFLEPDAVLRLLEESFLKTGHPKNLTVVHGLGISNGEDSGLLRFAHKGMIKRVIGGHWSWGPKLQQMCFDNEIEAYTFPAGCIITLMREIGAGRPGLITKTGLGTFADPQLGGGKCNDCTTEDLVERIEIEGETFLRYKPFKIDVAVIRGSYMDLTTGNITSNKEPADLDCYPIAMAGHNSGGVVLAEIRDTGDAPILPARLVSVPGIMVNAYVQDSATPQHAFEKYDPAISGEVAREQGSTAHLDYPVGIRAMIAERAADELKGAWSVNFGFGIPGGIPAVLQKRKVEYWGTLEQGIHCGDMLDGVVFGGARYPSAVKPSTEQFDFYSGGGIDTAFLGMGEMDQYGHVNVSKLGKYIVGPGGFVDITQNAKKVVFCGTFEAKGLKVSHSDKGTVSIDCYGEIPKLVKNVQHLTFSADVARAKGQKVIYVTERAVFELVQDGIALIEVAQGVDMQRDVLDRMQFTPIIAL